MTPPQQTLDQMKEGNKRYMTQRFPAELKEKLRERQEPKAIVLCCSDSRVPTELVFDMDVGELFVVRLAGNVASPIAVDSIEFAVEQLHVPLIVIMGHEGCGAVQAAMAGQENKGLLDLIMPAIKPDDTLEQAVVANIRNSKKQLLAQSALVRERIKEGKLVMALAEYSFEDGKVVWLDR